MAQLSQGHVKPMLMPPRAAVLTRQPEALGSEAQISVAVMTELSYFTDYCNDSVDTW